MGEQEKFSWLEEVDGTHFVAMVGNEAVAASEVKVVAEQMVMVINTAHASRLAAFKERAAKVAEEWFVKYDKTGCVDMPSLAAAIRALEEK